MSRFISLFCPRNLVMNHFCFCPLNLPFQIIPTKFFGSSYSKIFSISLIIFIFLILVIVGGSFFSTSSGLRFIKIYSLFKYSVNQILSFSKPKNIFMNRLIFTKINFDFNEINKYFFLLPLIILYNL